jgi:hypothetical protein
MSTSRNTDSTPLGTFASGVDTELKKTRPRTVNVKLILALFIMFMVVVSDAFTTSIISKFGDSAISGRNPTAWGTTLQGIFLVIGYIIMVYLIDNDVV